MTPNKLPPLPVTREGIVVEAGQVWRDLDKRMHGRCVRIARVENGFAYYETPVKNRIRIDRLRRPYWALSMWPSGAFAGEKA